MLFKNIIGHQELKKRLIDSVYDNRISHAQLFFGPEGCGKLQIALAYSQFINCIDKKDDDSCGVCISCLKFSKLSHPDLHFIYPVTSTKKATKPISKDFIVDWRNYLSENNYLTSLNNWMQHIGAENKQGIINTRDCNEIIKTISYKAYESEYKIMIIWLVEKLHHAAAPKLLKILEEPPEKTLFILISEDKEQIINTILSRTQQIKISKLSDELIIKSLIEKEDYSESEAIRRAQMSGGNYLKAINLVDIAGDDEHFKLFRKWMQLCFQKDLIKINEFTEDIAKMGRENQKHFLSYSQQIIRNSMLSNYSNSSLIKADKEEELFINKFAPFISGNSLIIMNEEINNAIYHIERNAHPKILFMDLSLTIIEVLKKV